MFLREYKRKRNNTLSTGYNFEQVNQWPANKANDWYARQGWIIGCNFIPSTAINSLEMWQQATFDPFTINKELSLAASLGFNSVRVFLHNLLWDQDAPGFLSTIEHFLSIATRHGIKTMFVLFDSVWNPLPKPGNQHAPVPGIHNSGWVQCPGIDILENPLKYDVLKGYVQGVIRYFKNDERVLVWDLFNEPDNMNLESYNDTYSINKARLSLSLLKKAFKWSREIAPVQPLTSAPWQPACFDSKTISEIDTYMFLQSDVITFHCYDKKENMEKCIKKLTEYNRPILCTEYLARPFQNTFENIIPLLKQYDVGGFNWGLVAGKTQTQLPWDSWKIKYESEPETWFHEIFKSNGEPYNEKEVAFVKAMTKRKIDTGYLKVA